MPPVPGRSPKSALQCCRLSQLHLRGRGRAVRGLPELEVPARRGVRGLSHLPSRGREAAGQRSVQPAVPSVIDRPPVPVTQPQNVCDEVPVVLPHQKYTAAPECHHQGLCERWPRIVCVIKDAKQYERAGRSGSELQLRVYPHCNQRSVRGKLPGKLPGKRRLVGFVMVVGLIVLQFCRGNYIAVKVL